MKKMKKVLSLVLVLIMVLSLFPVAAFAEFNGMLGSIWEPGEDIEPLPLPTTLPEVEEPEEEEAVLFDSVEQTFYVEDENGVAVDVEAPAGALPMGADLVVSSVAPETIQADVDALLGAETNVLLAMDISFVDENGVEVHPAADVKVMLSGGALADKENLQVVHFPDETLQPELVTQLDANDVAFEYGTNVAFQSKDFSVYAVIGGSGDEARATVEFYGLNDAKVATYYVKNSDQLPPAEGERDPEVQYLDEYVVDPGVGGQVPAGQIFVGWYIGDTNDFTVNTAPKTIAQVREYLDTLTITEGDVVKVWAMIFKVFTITYLDEHEISLGSDEIRILTTENSAPYTVSKNYEPTDPKKNFEGWRTEQDSAISNAKYDGEDVTQPYKMGTTMTVSGDIVFTVDAPTGHWLRYDENGKGATYNAPEFVKDGETTKGPKLEMSRLGYTFVGWYETKYADNADVSGVAPFQFGQTLDGDKTVYAKWDTVEKANYSVIFWLQKADEDGYDFAASDTKEGTVGTAITVSSSGSTVTARAGSNTSTYTFETGFVYDHADTDKTIAPDGSTVVNVYIHRQIYTLTFQVEDYEYTATTGNNGTQYGVVDGEHVQLTRSGDAPNYTWTYGTGEYQYVYNPTTSTSNYVTQYGLVNGEYVQLTRHGRNNNYYWTYGDTWSSEGTRYTGQRYTRDYQEIRETYTGTRYTRGSYGWHTIKTIEGRYGQSIKDEFPIVGSDGITYPTGTRWNPDSNLKVGDQQYFTHDKVISFIDRMTPGDMNFKFSDPEDRTDKTMVYWIETVNNTPSSSNVNTTTYKGVLYEEYKTVVAKYNGVTIEDYINLDGFVHFEADKTINDGDNGYYYDGNNRATTVNFYYTREVYSINYNDGAYFNGDGVELDYSSTGHLGTVDSIIYGSDISSYNKGGANFYEPSSAYPGFVLEGWYLDDTCTTPYTFTTMPKGGLTLYAKWRQIQYRIFLHPQAKMSDGTTNDNSLDWGDTLDKPQAMNFRISYGGQLSIPTGLRDTYEFIGWFTADGLPFDENAKFTEALVDTPYNKNLPENYTDKMNKFGEIEGTGWNSDLIGWDHDNDKTTPGIDRYWITKKLDLYGKWSAILPGAEGIGILYDAGAGSNAPTDTKKYKDNVDALAGTAPTPKEGERFLYWVVQTWDEDEGEYVDTATIVYPGAPFTAKKDLAKGIRLEESQIVYETDENGEYILDEQGNRIEKIYMSYTMQLRAEYGPASAPTPTHITWYGNGGTLVDPVDPVANKYGAIGTVGQTTTSYVDLQINEAVPVAPFATFARSGYKFVGWARDTEPEGAYNDENSTVDETKYTEKSDVTLWLKLNDDGVTFSELDASGNVIAGRDKITEVAADEKIPYHALYAVWQAQYYVYFSGSGKLYSYVYDGTELNFATNPNRTTGLLYAGYASSFGGYSVTDSDKTNADKAAGDGYTIDATENPTAIYDPDSLLVPNKGFTRWWKLADMGSKPASEIDPQPGQVFYIKEVPSKYLTSRIQYVYDFEQGNKLQDIYFLTVIDDSLFTDGIAKFGSAVELGNYKDGFGIDEVSVASSVTFEAKNSDVKVSTSPSDFAEVERGFIAYMNWADVPKTGDFISAEQTFYVQPFWVTLDGVTVYGTARTFNTGDGTCNAETGIHAVP